MRRTLVAYKIVRVRVNVKVKVKVNATHRSQKRRGRYDSRLSCLSLFHQTCKQSSASRTLFLLHFLLYSPLSKSVGLEKAKCNLPTPRQIELCSNISFSTSL